LRIHHNAKEKTHATRAGAAALGVRWTGDTLSRLAALAVVHAVMSFFLKIQKQIKRPRALNFEILEVSPKVAYLHVFRGEEEDQNF